MKTIYAHFGGFFELAKFACLFDLLVSVELHARWLDWCLIGSLSGDSFGGNACFGDCGVLGETAGALVSRGR